MWNEDEIPDATLKLLKMIATMCGAPTDARVVISSRNAMNARKQVDPIRPFYEEWVKTLDPGSAGCAEVVVRRVSAPPANHASHCIRD